MPNADLEAKVLDDLKALRKSAAGVTVQSLAEATTLCRLLGDGDPYVAYTRLQHALLDATSDRTVRAAAASLGFSSEGQSHLERLEDAGLDLGGIDQRQARRLSDRGLQVIARLIATNWTVEAVPQLTTYVTRAETDICVFVTTTAPAVVEMSEPEIELKVGLESSPQHVTWLCTDDGTHVTSHADQPIIAPATAAETSMVIVWRGELWPKFTVRWLDAPLPVTSESLGNKLMLRLRPDGIPRGD